MIPGSLAYQQMNFTTDLIAQLTAAANPAQAKEMNIYMRERYSFFGVKAPQRKAILKTTIDTYKSQLDRPTVITIVKELYTQPQRELHYCAIELVTRFLKKKFQKEDITFIQQLIITHSWWDTVDMIAKHHLGGYLKSFPKETTRIIQSFSNADHLWLNRSAILFQLDYKKETNADLLFQLCLKHKNTGEFFINKAIGWALREYAKTNPQAVITFVSEHSLSPLSEQEALKKLR
ncbi:DNA alkylation repair protein [Dokdonia ponticola]|uniref:DNA alkylation repair protein n=1 Tax=Dokdonia ponticola TaxID=2041041 RepID=A0ABV9HSX0_9FLAO